MLANPADATKTVAAPSSLARAFGITTHNMSQEENIS